MKKKTRKTSAKKAKLAKRKRAKANEGQETPSTQSDTAATPAPISFGMIQLEDRVLYDAAPFDVEMVQTVDTSEQAPVDPLVHEPIDWTQATTVENVDGEQAGQNALDQINFAIEQLQNGEADRQLIVVDSTVEDYQSLLDSVATTASFDLLIVQPDEDGIAKVTERLQAMQSVSAIHILSHGQAGQFAIGNALLSLESWDQYEGLLQQWNQFLGHDADLMIYGCDVAGNADGELLLHQLATATDAEVAASTDLTGHEDLGGDWDLEFAIGEIQSEVIVQQETQQQWTYVLPVTVLPTAVPQEEVFDPFGFEINAERENRGATSAVAMDANGNYVIVWSQDTLTNGWEVYGQKYDYFGDEVGSSFRINESRGGDERFASVAMDDLGNFVVTWADESNNEIFYRYYSFDGGDSGEVYLGEGDDSSVTMNSAGQFAVIWEGDGPGDSSGIFASIFDADGGLVEGELRVNSTTSGFQRNADISMNDSGELVAVWESPSFVMIQRISADGNWVGSETVVGSVFGSPVGYQNGPTVELLNNGDFLVSGTVFIFGSSYNIVSAFDADNDIIQSQVVGSTSDGYQYNASIELVSDEEFFVTWSGNGDQAGNVDDEGVFMARYRFDGANFDELQAENRVNNHTAGEQNNASIAATTADRYVVVWDGAGPSSSTGIYHASVGLLNHAPVSTDPATFGTENIDFVIRDSHFGYSDFESSPMDSVLITELPANGELYLDGSLIAAGTRIDAADIRAGLLEYRQTTDGYGDNFDQFKFYVSDGDRDSIAEATMEIDLFPRNQLWLSTRDDNSSATDVPGSDNWGEGEVLQFGGTNFQLGDDTDGFFSNQFRFEDFASGNVDGIHYVTQSLTLGTNDTFTLNVGDIVFSLNDNNVTIPGITELVEQGDIVVFRPTSADYSTGDFTLLVDRSSMAIDVQSDLDNVRAFTIIQQDTMIAEQPVFAGQILFSGAGFNNDVLVLQLDEVGEGTTQGSTYKLLEGRNVEINRQIWGLDLVERDTVVGGEFIGAGTLIVSVNNDDDVGDNEIDASEFDIFALDLTQTSVIDSASGNASILFDGSDVNWDEDDDRRIDAISLNSFDQPLNLGPTVGDQNFSINENSANGEVVGSILATDPNNGDVLRYEIVGGDGGDAFEVDLFTGEIRVRDTVLLDHEVNEMFTLQISVTDSEGMVDTAIIEIDIDDLSEANLSGSIWQDLNGDGILSDAVGFEDGIVKLYWDANDNDELDADDRLIRIDDSLGSDGLYQFEGVADGNYFVVVDSKSLEGDVSYNGGHDHESVWAEQTWGSENSLYDDDGDLEFSDNSGSLFGGRMAGQSDDQSDFDLMQHVTWVEVEGSDVDDVDFGFSYNVVTNLGGGDDAAVDGQTDQGTLRQFIINANALDGGNEMRFVPAVDSNEPTNETWELLITEALPWIVDDGTVINGQAYDRSFGNFQIEPNTERVGIDSTSVGTNDLSVATIDLPELSIISDNRPIDQGLMVAGADSVVIENVKVAGFGSGFSGANILVVGSDDFLLQNSLIADASGSNITLTDTDGARISNNVIEDSGGFGIRVDSDLGPNRHTLVENNFITGNGHAYLYADGIDVQRDSDATIQRNWIVGNYGSGIDTYENSQSLVIQQNTVMGNGFGLAETAGIRLFGSNHEVTGNIIQGNAGDGVTVVGLGVASPVVSSNNLISENLFGGNAGLAIDLSPDAATFGMSRLGDGVTDSFADPSVAGNQGMMRPTITDSLHDGVDTTTIEGTAGANQRIELYAAIADADGSDDHAGNSYGEGVRYLGWAMTNGSGNFSFLTTDLAINESVAAIAIDSSNNTSEFSENVEVNVAPTSDDITMDLQGGDTHVFELDDFDFSDDDLDSLVHIQFTDAETSGQLFLDGVPVSNLDPISATQLTDGDLTYEAVGDAIMTDVLTFQVFDGTDYSVEHTLTINVANDGPEFTTSDNLTINENDNGLIIEADDPEGFALTYEISGGEDKNLFSIDLVSGELTFDIAPDFENPTDQDRNNEYEVEILVTDSAGNQETQLFNISVQPVEDNAPVFSGPTTFNILENNEEVAIIEARDLDLPGDDLEYSINNLLGDGSLFVIDADSGELKFDSAPDFESKLGSLGENQYSVQVIVTDGSNIVTRDLVVNVLPVNEFAPQIAGPDDVSVAEGETDVVAVTSSDLDEPAESVQFTMVDGFGDNEHFEVDRNTGQITFKSPPNFEEPMDGDKDNKYVIRVMVEDLDGFSTVKEITVTVTDVNEVIEDFVLTPADIDEHSPSETTVGTIVVDDPDLDDEHTYVLLDDADGRFTVDSDGIVSLTLGTDLDYEAIQTHTITVQVTDSIGHQLTKDITIFVNEINENPVAVDLDYVVNEGASIVIPDSDFSSVFDPDGDDLTYSIHKGPAHGTLVKTVGGTRYIHDGSETTSDSFIYRVSDGRGGFDTGLISLVINPVNDAPIATGETVVHAESGALVIGQNVILQNDTDAEFDPLRAVVVNGPSTGNLIVRPDGTWVFIPDGSTGVTETIEYRVTDGDKVSQTVKLTIISNVTGPETAEEETPSDDNEGNTTDPIGGTNDPTSPDEGNNGNTNGVDDDDSDRSFADTLPSKIDDADSRDNLASEYNPLQNTNYVFSYQKSSIDLSGLIANAAQDANLLSSLTADAAANSILADMWVGLDHVNSEIMDNISVSTNNLATAASLTGVFTVGYVLWMVRGGMLVASLVSVPALKDFDPLPILQYAADMEVDGEGDSIESILKQGETV